MNFCRATAVFLKFRISFSYLNTCWRCNSLYDKHFIFFRNKKEYKSLVIQLNDDLSQSKVAGPGFSFLLKEHDIPTSDYFSYLMLRENVMKLSAIQIKDLLFLMANIKIDTVKYAPFLKYLDEKCALSTERWPLDFSFYILDAWFIIEGHKIFRQHYYSALTNQWGRRMKKCSKYNLILMLYYIGASKKAPPFLMECIEDKMEQLLEEFTDEEWAVACLSFFKTSKHMTSNVLLQHASKAMVNLLTKNDRFNAIAILKCFRLSKYQDSAVWQAFKKHILDQSIYFNFVECTNFLAAFSSLNMYDKVSFELLEKQGILQLNEENKIFKNQSKQPNIHPSLRSRVKDLARFLWAMTSVRHNIEKNTVNFVIDTIQTRMDAGEFVSHPHVLVDCAQSLVLADTYPIQILNSILNTTTLKKLKYSDRAKPKYQLYFIQKSLQIEKPELCFSLPNLFNPIPKSIEKDIKERPGFKDLIHTLSKIQNTTVQPCYIIPHIMISGILIRDSTKEEDIGVPGSHSEVVLMKKLLEDGLISHHVKDIVLGQGQCFCIELLDPTVCVNGSRTLNGLMATKIRQLKKMNFKVHSLYTSNLQILFKKIDCKKYVNISDLFKNFA